MNPMGSNSSSYFNPFELGGGGGNNSAMIPFMGSASAAANPNLLTTQELSDLGLIDPLFGMDVSSFDSPDAGYLTETGAGYFDEGY